MNYNNYPNTHLETADISSQALGYLAATENRGRITLHQPPGVRQGDLYPSDATKFGKVLKEARLSLEQISSHAVPDAEIVPILEEIARLQAEFPAPPTQLERDLQRMADTSKALAKATGALVHTPRRIVRKFSHSPRHSAGREK